jgi:hypothetical protein
MRLSAALLVLAGCLDTAAQMPPPSNVTCGGDPTLDAIQRDIFSQSCAFGSCHAGSNPAAGLDLSAGKTCGSLVGRPSCLFGDRQRVIPGKPDDSYLISKLEGKNMGSNPNGPCALAANGRPQRMPLGAEPLCQGRIDQVRAWIAAGAPGCMATPDGGPPDAGIPDAPPLDASVDAPLPASPIAALSVAASSIRAGDRTQATATLAAPAPAGGQSIYIQVLDSTVLAAPGELFVAAGATTADFEVAGLRPSHAITIRARAGGAWADAQLAVSGLALAEIYPNAPDGSQWVELANVTGVPIDLSRYGLTSASALSGIVPAGECFVVGGPTSSAQNGWPLYSLTLDLRLPLAGTVALDDLDELSYGTQQLPTPPPGFSLRRTRTGWARSTPMPNICPNGINP